MNPDLSKYLFYYPTTVAKGEFIWRHLSNYRRFQNFSPDRIAQYQVENFRRLLKHAYANSPFYKNSFDQAGIKPEDFNSLEDAKHFPCITKDDLASHKSQIVTTQNQFFVSTKTTGGSTGQVVTLDKNADALARERAATWRAYEWAGVSIGDPQARFWGTPLHQSQRLKYKLIDLIANRMRLSAFEINDERLEVYFRKLISFKPAYLYGYVSIIEAFAEFVRKMNYELPDSILSVITTSEVLTEYSRENIESAFNRVVFNEYGCGEVGSIAHDCEYHNMHVMEDNLILEIETDDESDAGEIIVTDLFNYTTPLIRYRIGDYGSFSSESCPCGRGLKTIANIHGRAYDMIYTREGNSYHPELVMYIFEDIKEKTGGIAQFQVIQETVELMIIKIVKSTGYTADLERYIEQELQARLSPFIVAQFEYVDSISRENSGKLRLIKSNLKQQAS
jgi:phenylacetate-CoA ligase